ncbi:MAG: type II toxin-antitoxin system VapC family toxin [Thermoleophilia bacterium]|nr:type II toxin-antitoxin system VapC family toxin [Thermoleophilia bacterium]MDH4340431.1 type II toxin-antitoxin system VapC family toxin [Thermoleophilia bacterium]MDH5280246.1 type II toxin-antitoxin system VapC family toxin [Thermoleophilia bacterium]
MTILDTHVWLWWLGDDPRLSRPAREAVEASGEIGVSAMSVWELATLERLGRLRLVPDIRTWVRRALARADVSQIAVTTEIALAAGSLLPPFPGDPADRIIYATALLTDARLVSGDRRIHRHDPERVVW